MEEQKFYNSRIQMFIILIVSCALVIMIAFAIYSGSDIERNWRYWTGLILCSLVEMLFLYMVVYSFKQLINPTLLITVTDKCVIVQQDKRSVDIGWEDIDSYMLCRTPRLSGGSEHFYIFMKDETAAPTTPKQIKIDYNYMKNKHKLKAAFDEKNIEELSADYEVVRDIK
ncbi:hypothetical protein [Bacillus infantis]|uniref:hypothetical protein n=1 Tax=Bacillus infantis TaxID=324767 RepID=UPI002155F2C5|nr:hypothetical protein [Bacillus infantis]MCR6609571.1 hypothetical protein [Bacillus infantis]